MLKFVSLISVLNYFTVGLATENLLASNLRFTYHTLSLLGYSCNHHSEQEELNDRSDTGAVVYEYKNKLEDYQ